MKQRIIRTAWIDFRHQLGMSQKEFAEKLGISQPQLAGYEINRRTPRALIWRRMVLSAKQFGIELPESLFFQEEEPIKQEEIVFKTNSIKEMREYLGKDQNEMAEELGLHYRRLGRYERGESDPPLPIWIKMQRYAQHFGIQLESRR
jgi:transcriptional regulator with XRE-family HTH domain